MSDLISRNALIRRFAYYHAHSYGKAEYAYGVAVEETLKAPTIDAVPVVRCRECKYYNRALQLCNNGLGTREFDFYCADGKKTDGGADNG